MLSTTIPEEKYVIMSRITTIIRRSGTVVTALGALLAVNLGVANTATASTTEQTHATLQVSNTIQAAGTVQATNTVSRIFWP